MNKSIKLKEIKAIKGVFMLCDEGTFQKHDFSILVTSSMFTLVSFSF